MMRIQRHGDMFCLKTGEQFKHEVCEGCIILIRAFLLVSWYMDLILNAVIAHKRVLNLHIWWGYMRHFTGNKYWHIIEKLLCINLKGIDLMIS